MERVNYITEINMFYDWLETNQIPKSAIALWHTLMHIANKARWEHKFTVATSTIESKSGFKRSELFKARNLLEQKGRLIWKSRGGNLCAEYELIFFCVHNAYTNGNTNAYTNGNTNAYTNGSQMVTINKQNQTKPNKTKTNISKSHSENEFSVLEKIENLDFDKKQKSEKKQDSGFYQIFVKIWFEFYQEKIQTKPIFNSVDGTKIKSIEKKLKQKSEEFSIEWTSEVASDSFMQFLEIAFNDKWRSENFSLSVIDSQFNQITAKALKNDNSNSKIEQFFNNW